MAKVNVNLTLVFGKASTVGDTLFHSLDMMTWLEK